MCWKHFWPKVWSLWGLTCRALILQTVRSSFAHRIALSRGLTVMENLDLSAVMAGSYELIALPLPLEGVEASPVRAVLRSIP